jgi:hypothetical protein
MKEKSLGYRLSLVNVSSDTVTDIITIAAANNSTDIVMIVKLPLRILLSRIQQWIIEIR